MKKILTLSLVSLGLLTACSQATSTNTSSSRQEGSSNMTSSSPFSGVEKATVVANTTDLAQSDVDAIVAKYEEFQQALVDRDMTKLRQLLPDDYTARHITGRTQTKEEWLSDVESGQMVYYAFTDMRLSLSQDGDQVVMGVEQNIRANIYGSEGTWSIPGERRFEKVNGSWQIAA